MKKTFTKAVVLLLLATGISLSFYLFYRHLDLYGQAGAGMPDFCSRVFGQGCDEALGSRFSIWMGLPLAGWGLVYYTMLATLLLLASHLDESFGRKALTASLGLSLLGGLMALGMLMLMALHPALFCPLCAIIHLINLLLIFPLKRIAGQSWSGLFTAVAAGFRYLFTGRSSDAIAARWATVAFLLVLFVGLAFFQWGRIIILQSESEVEFAFNPEKIIADFENTAEMDILVEDNDPRLGPDSAPLQLVIFSDFQCPACQHLSEWIPLLGERFGDQLQIIFKNFPLSPACNPGVEVEIHPRACGAALAAEAAAIQGAFWPFHDALFRISWQKDGEGAILKAAAGLDLDLQQFEQDVASATVQESLEADVAEGLRLEIDATPAVFLNGRPIYDLRPESLRTLIGHALYRQSGDVK